MEGIGEITLWSGLITLASLFVAVTAFAGLLRWLDRLAEIRFRRDIVPLIKKSSLAAAFYFGLRLLAIAIIVASVLGCSAANAGTLTDGQYDRAIERAVKRWWPDIPLPNLLKAQLFQESRLDPMAVSPVGARGLGQFMPATWDEVARELAFGNVSPHLADPAIEAAAYYMAKQRRFPDWKKWSDPDRHRMAQAAYNAGAGNIRKALRRCGAGTWAASAVCLPQITGKHSVETITYVGRIARWFEQLEARL